MKKRPFILFLCALSFLYFPGELAYWISEGEPIVAGDVVFSIVLPLFVLIGLIRVTKVGWYTLIAFGALWGMRDIYFYYSSYGTSLVPILFHVGIYFLSLGYFINPRIRHLYFDPKLRWWRTKRRFETHGPLIARSDRGWEYPNLGNISEGGCFVETDKLLDLNQIVKISIPLPVPLNLSVIKAEGEVRWRSDHPKKHGMGIQFRNLSKANLKAIKTYVRKQL